MASLASGSSMAIELVEAYAQGRVNRRVLTGKPVYRGEWTLCTDGVQRRLVRFPVGARFVLDLWECNDYGTTRWRVVVAQAGGPGEACTVLPGVRPGASILTDIQGAQRVRAFLAWIRENRDRISQFSEAELARIELHFLRTPLARLRQQNHRQRGQ